MNWGHDSISVRSEWRVFGSDKTCGLHDYTNEIFEFGSSFVATPAYTPSSHTETSAPRQVDRGAGVSGRGPTGAWHVGQPSPGRVQETSTVGQNDVNSLAMCL